MALGLGFKEGGYYLTSLVRRALIATASTEDAPPITHHFIKQLMPEDILIACSDGVWNYFSASEMGSALSMLSPREAAEFLIQKARSRARGGGDNLSLVIIKLEPLG